jgi:hypothetical protein
MNAEWFDMNDLKRHTFDNKVWIPLYAQERLFNTGELTTGQKLNNFPPGNKIEVLEVSHQTTQ